MKAFLHGIIFTLLFSVTFSLNAKAKPRFRIDKKDITCESIFVKVNDEEVEKNTFVYGEKFKVYFNDIKGFKKIDGAVFPKLDIVVIDENKDTVLIGYDLYRGQGGFTFDPLALNASVSCATPVHVGKDYIMKVYISDKNGKGYINLEYDFEVIRDPNIKISSKGLNYEQFYLFSDQRGIAFSNHEATYKEKVYLIIEGLEGLDARNGLANMYVSITVRNSDGKVIIEEKDMFPDPVDVKLASEQLNLNFHIDENPKGGDLNTSCEVIIKDKNDAKKVIKVKFNVLIKE